MSLRTRMLPVFDQLRAKTGPSGFDIRPTSLAIIARRWTSGTVGVEPDDPSLPPFTDARFEMPAVFKVRQVNTHEIASSGGRYEMGNARLGPITPAYTKADGTSGGVSEEQLKPSATDDATEIVYELAGAHAGEYALVALESTAPFGWWLVLTRRETTP
jgi:hypothetical protein